MNGESRLLANIVMFVRLLRTSGVPVSSMQVMGFVQALEYIRIGNREDFRNTARTALVNRFNDLPLFDRVFELFWAGHPPSEREGLDLGMLQQRSREMLKQLGLESRRTEHEEENQESAALQVYSDRERLYRKDFAELDPDELAQIKSLIREIDWSLQLRPSRRRVEGRRRELIDFRRTVRCSLRHGGESILLHWRQVRPRRRPLVVLCDISGSMQPYSRLLLEFIYSMNLGLEAVESFAFGTRLTRLTRHLRERQANKALRESAWAIGDWGGGTRIGEAIKEFNYSWGRRVLKSSSIALIISDGWDRGDIPLLEREIGRLRRSCWRLIWLNPLLGSPRYEPRSRGIRAVLPLLDLFLPVHNLVSLEQLGKTLRHLSGFRVPVRYSDLTSTVG